MAVRNSEILSAPSKEGVPVVFMIACKKEIPLICLFSASPTSNNRLVWNQHWQKIVNKSLTWDSDLESRSNIIVVSEEEAVDNFT